MQETEQITSRDIPPEIALDSLTIEVTTLCNSRCAHCFARAGLSQRTAMSLENAGNIISEGFAIGYRKLHMTGGEALLWEHFYDAIDHATGLGYESLFFNSNGLLLSSGICARLSAYGERLSLSVSLQGPRDLHERIRGQGMWDKAVRGIANALNAGLKLEVFTSVGRSLLPELPRFVEWLYGEFPGIDSLKLIQLIRVTGDEMDLSEELLAPEDFISLVKTAALLNLCGRRVSVLDNPFASAVAARLGMPWIPQALPLHRAGRIVVMADLTITHSHSSRVVLGMYSPGALEKVFRSPAYHDMTEPDHGTCPQCEHMDICRAHEMARPSEWYRDMYPETPYCKRVMKIISGQQ